LFEVQAAGAAFMAKAGQPFDPVFFIQTVPSPHGIVVDE